MKSSFPSNSVLLRLATVKRTFCFGVWGTSYVGDLHTSIIGADTSGELTREEILDNITLFWVTNTAVSASRLYWEYKGGYWDAKGVNIPVAVSVFPGEQYQAPRSWTERAYPKLIYYNAPDQGGHFAAWEQPQLFASEVRAAFRSLRK